jgi:alkylation response protein AidB-like acyl-CoA dehydrogenase
VDIIFSEEERAFQADVRDFINNNLPEDVRRRSQRFPSYVSKEQTTRWHKILHAKGWSAPAWPKEHGGTGWSVTQKFLYDEEYQAAGCPRQSPFGLTMVGPVLYTFGTDEQKQRYLPKIVSGDEFWCQGYSEPGAGSDLANLQTRAIPDGDDYVVNGQKIWTSHAHHADMMFCLVRTNTEVKAQEGISFILIDMTTPGLTVKPIISIDGSHYLNEVFFDNVRVPIANRIGEENKGWTYAKFLLGHERTGIAGVAKSKTKVARLKQIASVEGQNGIPLAEDDSFRMRLSDIEVSLHALEITNLRMMAGLRDGGGPGPESSTLKISGTTIEQALNELSVEAIGYYAGVNHAEAQNPEINEPPIGPDHGVGLMNERLLRRAATIYGGSNEIQKNIIAKAVLGL